MAVEVEGHLDRRMPHQRLHSLRRKLPLDRPACEEVPECMQAILMPAVAVDHPSRDLQGVPSAICDIRVVLDVAVAIGEDEPYFALGAGQPPLPQRVDDHWRHWDDALARR